MHPTDTSDHALAAVLRRYAETEDRPMRAEVMLEVARRLEGRASARGRRRDDDRHG